MFTTCHFEKSFGDWPFSKQPTYQVKEYNSQKGIKHSYLIFVSPIHEKAVISWLILSNESSNDLSIFSD